MQVPICSPISTPASSKKNPKVQGKKKPSTLANRSKSLTLKPLEPSYQPQVRLSKTKPLRCSKFFEAQGLGSKALEVLNLGSGV